MCANGYSEGHAERALKTGARACVCVCVYVCVVGV